MYLFPFDDGTPTKEEGGFGSSILVLATLSESSIAAAELSVLLCPTLIM
jgi:hypothetical protein